MQRPDLSNVDPQIVAYIEHLEGELEALTAKSETRRARPPVDFSDKPDVIEPATTMCLTTISPAGIGKRSYRHNYPVQHRGGMGIFDLEVSEPDFPSILVNAEERKTLLLFTDKARAFRYPLNKLDDSEVRSKGAALMSRFDLEPDEKLVAALPEQATGYVVFVSETGKTRVLRHHLFGDHLQPGKAMYKVGEYGPLAAVCWAEENADVFVATRGGMGIRYSRKLIQPQGTQSIRLAEGDQIAAVTAVYPESGVFLLGADGKGTIRLMTGFAPNKSSGGSGKITMKNDQVIAAHTVTEDDDIFIISRTGKLIRFRADEIPASEGVVQGVNCISMRSDNAVTATIARRSL